MGLCYGHRRRVNSMVRLERSVTVQIATLLFLSSIGVACGASSAAPSSAWEQANATSTNDRTNITGASAFLVPASNFTLTFIPEANATYARIPRTVVGGSELLNGSTNLQPTFEACAASCSRIPTCIAFDWCPTDKCPVDLNGDKVPQFACQPHYQQPAEEAKGVEQVGSGNPRLGDAGVRILVNPPAEPPRGYVIFPAQSLQDVYEIPCEGSPVPDQCVLLGQLQELVGKCDAWPACKAVVIGPRGWGPFNTPYGELKGSVNNTDEKIDPKKGNINPVTYTLVKTSALAPEEGVGGGGSGGLSAGAVAGIAGGAVALAAGVAAAVTLLVLRRRRRGVIELKLSQGQSSGSSLGEDLMASMGKGGGSADSTKKLVARLLSEAPSPVWGDVVVPREAVKFSTKNGKAVRLGAGASGAVFRGMLHGATPCALKVFDFHQDASLPRHFIQEAVMLRRLSNPSVVQFLGVTVTEGRGLLIMELVAGGDLGTALRADSAAHAKDPSSRTYSWYNRGRMVALQVAAGLHYLHSQKALHLDIKPGNILLGRDGAAKLGDVGFSRMLQHSHISVLEGRIGTFTWCAPEVLLGGRATEKSDVYSYGVVLWEIITGQQPVRGLMQQLDSPRECPADVADLQMRCMRQEASERPTMEEVVQVLRAVQARMRSTTKLTQQQGAGEVDAQQAIAGAAPITDGVVETEVGPEAAFRAVAPEAGHAQRDPQQQEYQLSVASSRSQLVSCPSDAAPPNAGSLPSSAAEAAARPAPAAAASALVAPPSVKAMVAGQGRADSPQPPSPTVVAGMHFMSSLETSSSRSLPQLGAGANQQQQQPAQQPAQKCPYQCVQLPKQAFTSPFAYAGGG